LIRTYRPGTILGAGETISPVLPSTRDAQYAGTAHPRLPTGGDRQPDGFVGFAWMDYDETMANTPYG
jgi:hypothetical protein